ncbi:MAG: hypothetical protein ACK4VK_08450, partial [Aquificaceae bacterium]
MRKRVIITLNEDLYFILEKLREFTRMNYSQIIRRLLDGKLSMFDKRVHEAEVSLTRLLQRDIPEDIKKELLEIRNLLRGYKRP